MNNELMVVVDKYQLLVPTSGVQKGSYDKNGSKKLVRGNIVLSKQWVEGRNSQVNNELYIINEEATAELPALRAAKAKKREEAKAMENVNPYAAMNDLAKSIGKLNNKPQVEEATIVPETKEVVVSDKVKELRAECDKLEIDYRHNAGEKKLTQLIENHNK